MGCLKSVFCRLRKCMSMQRDRPAIPEALKMRLWTAGGLVAGVLAVGIYMEYQMGNGFLKLSCVCSACLGIRFVELLWVIYYRRYEVIEGEVVRIQICGIREREWEVLLRNQLGEEKTVWISSQSDIRKGTCYRIYLKEEEVLGIEKLGV